MQGNGGVEAFNIYFGNIHHIPELTPVRVRMKTCSLYVERAFSLIEEKMRARPPRLREEEIFDTMGAVCPKCSSQYTVIQASRMGRKCLCGGPLEYDYVKCLKELISQGIMPSPEAVIAYRAFDYLAEAYRLAYHGMYLITRKIAADNGWETYQVRDATLRNYWDQLFLGRIQGQQHLMDEEKKTLQLITRGVASNIPLCRFQNGIKNAAPVCVYQIITELIAAQKYGQLYEDLGIPAAYQHYSNHIRTVSEPYNRINALIEQNLGQCQEGSHRTHATYESGNGTFAPYWRLERRCWESGSFSSNLAYMLCRDLPIHPKYNFGAIVLFFAPQGSGKTFSESAIITDAYLNTGEFIFSPLGDKSNNFTTACIPLFKYSRRTAKLHKILTETLGVKPQGIPMVHLTVLKKDEKIEDKQLNPPTIFDVILEVNDYDTLEVPFDKIFERLREVNEWYGNQGESKGIITIRNLDRYNRATNTNIDLRILTIALDQFGKYRKGHPKPPGRVFIDELSYSAASQIDIGGSDASRSAGIIDDNAKETRRNNAAFDGATQIPKEVIGNLRKGMTVCFFKELGQSNDKQNSEIDFVLGMLKLQDNQLRPVIRRLNEAGLPDGAWFGWDRPSREIHVYKPCPPCFTLNDTERTPYQILSKYDRITSAEQLKKAGLTEKQLGDRKILLKSWREVPRWKADGTEKKERRKVLL
jgi:hypothetical protein